MQDTCRGFESAKTRRRRGIITHLRAWPRVREGGERGKVPVSVRLSGGLPRLGAIPLHDPITSLSAFSVVLLVLKLPLFVAHPTYAIPRRATSHVSPSEDTGHLWQLLNTRQRIPGLPCVLTPPAAVTTGLSRD